MLWGYTDKDLQAGEDAKLVKALDDDTLAVRVLSFLEPQGHDRAWASSIGRSRRRPSVNSHAALAAAAGREGDPPEDARGEGRRRRGRKVPAARTRLRPTRRPVCDIITMLETTCDAMIRGQTRGGVG